MKAVRTSNAAHTVFVRFGSQTLSFPLTTTYATYTGSFTLPTDGAFALVIESQSTNSAAFACVDSVSFVPPNQSPAFSAFTVTPSGVQQAPVTNISLSATAADPDTSGYVGSIEFLINGASANPALMCTNNATTPAKPFTCNQTWTGAVAGTNYSMTARAIDNNAAPALSVPIALAFNRPPTATFTSPVANAQLAGPNAVVQLSVTTTDPDGDAISKVEFYNGATLLGTVTTSQAATANQPTQSGNVYVLNSAALAAGSYTITAKVYDNRGGSTQAPLPSVAFTVKATNNVPVATLATVPVGVTTASFGAAVSFTASATDNDSAIASISIVDTSTGAVLRTCTYAAGTSVVPCAVTVSNLAVGSHAIVARATDSVGGAVGESAVINLTITAAQMTCGLSMAPNPPNVGAPAQLAASCLAGSTPVGGVTYTWERKYWVRSIDRRRERKQRQLQCHPGIDHTSNLYGHCNEEWFHCRKSECVADRNAGG